MEIDCSFTEEIVCPHCGYEFSDSYELFEFHNSHGEYNVGVECDECSKEFNAGRCIEVTYSSYIPKEKYERP
jgi:hypothetical protein